VTRARLEARPPAGTIGRAVRSCALDSFRSRIMPRFAFALALLLAGPAAAQEWPMAPEYDVLVTSYAIQPQVIRLKAGEPVRLRFVNNSNERHRFAAAAFFRAAAIRPGDSDAVAHGGLVLPPLTTRTIGLVPKAGRYPVRGDNLVHRFLGMTARIDVEQE
jgi:plastocyanin